MRNGHYRQCWLASGCFGLPCSGLPLHVRFCFFPLIQEVFRFSGRSPLGARNPRRLVTSDEMEATDFLVANAPLANWHLRRLKSLGLLS